MRKLMLPLIGAIVMMSITSCATMENIDRGRSLRFDEAYVALMFTNKRSFVSIGTPSVYLVLYQAGGGTAYVPFGYDGDLVLLKVTPGDYRIAGFVYTIGATSAGPMSGAVMNGSPVRPGDRLADASFPKSYLVRFSAHAGELSFLGAYSWKNQLFSLGPAVTVERSAVSSDAVLAALRRDHPSTPASLRFVDVTK